MQSIANMVQELNDGYAFYIFCSNTDLHELPLHITQTDSWVPFNAYTKVWYAGRPDRSKHLLEQLKIIEPDKLFITGLFSWHFTMVPLFFCKGPQKILSVRGMLHPGALGQKWMKKKVFLQWMKWLQLAKRCSFHATDAQEAEHIRKQFGSPVSIYEAGNFPRWIGGDSVLKKEPGHLKLVSIGIVSPMKNILLVLQALQHCRGNIAYDIYGPVKEPVYWEHCLQQIKLLPQNIQVNYHKEITPDKVPEKLSCSHVFIMPSKSENFGHAIYEALSAGLPVITSGFTPWNKLEENNAGKNVVAKKEFLQQAIEFFVVMEHDQYGEWSAAAAAYARAKIDKEHLKEVYKKMFS